MQKGLLTRYKIHEILKILKNKPFNFDLIFSKKTEKVNISISDMRMIQNVVLSSMRYYSYIDIINSTKYIFDKYIFNIFIFVVWIYVR